MQPGLLASAALLLLLSCRGYLAAEPASVPLPQPEVRGGKPLMEALQARRTGREIGADPVSNQVLGNLLWAGFGVNRPATSHRTAPSALNSQEVDIYVARADGVFVYEPKSHSLAQVLKEDIRRRISGQEFMKSAPIVLVYVADLSRLAKAAPESREKYAHVDTGCIAQNVYLFCASENLATVVFEPDRKNLGTALPLRPDQRMILGQAIGHPAIPKAGPAGDPPK